MQIEEALQQLESITGYTPTRGGGGWWKARCPCHSDTNPSLGVKEGDKGSIIFFCRSEGCPASSIREALMLGTNIEYKEEVRVVDPNLFWKSPVQSYHLYWNANNTPVYRKVKVKRIDDGTKDFRIQYLNEKWKWENKNVLNVPMIPYNEHLLHQNISGEDSLVLIQEGEKDADNVLQRLGITSTANFDGAIGWNYENNLKRLKKGETASEYTSKWKLSYFDNLNRICVTRDEDIPGILHSKYIISWALHLKENEGYNFDELSYVTFPKKNKPKGYDTTDWLDEGNGIDEWNYLYSQDKCRVEKYTKYWRDIWKWFNDPVLMIENWDKLIL